MTHACPTRRSSDLPRGVPDADRRSLHGSLRRGRPPPSGPRLAGGANRRHRRGVPTSDRVATDMTRSPTLLPASRAGRTDAATTARRHKGIDAWPVEGFDRRIPGRATIAALPPPPADDTQTG